MSALKKLAKKIIYRNNLAFTILSYLRSRKKVEELGFAARPEEKFSEIYKKKLWGKSDESFSGPGSSLEQTKTIRIKIPELISRHKIKTMLDVPCGDFNWMKEVKLEHVKYTGADIVQEIVNSNNKKYSGENRSFIKLNLINEVPERFDLIFCRDLFIHLSYEDIFSVIRNMQKSGTKYLLASTYTSPKRININIKTGGFRVLNLQKKPFSFPAPIEIINEESTEHDGVYPDKSLALWNLSELVV